MALYTADLTDAEAIVDGLFTIYDAAKSSNATEKYNKKQDWLEALGLLYTLREAVSANATASITSYLAELNLFAPKAGVDAAGAITPSVIEDSDGFIEAVGLVSTGVNAQSITSASDTISFASYTEISADAQYTLTSTPSVAPPTNTNGTSIMVIHNGGSNAIVIQDQDDLASSGINLGAASGTLAADETIVLAWDSAESYWMVISKPNNLTSSGSQVVRVRNSSGSTITKGSPVYIDGYNTGQGLLTVDLADQDDSAKMPALGLANTDIANNSNGDIVVSGLLTGLNTSSYSANDSLYVSSTAGQLTSTKPQSDDIQSVAIVGRSHASSGVIFVKGAGRVNDTPRTITAGRPVTSTITGNVSLNALVKNTDYLLDTDLGSFSITVNSATNTAWNVGDSVRFFHYIPTNTAEINVSGVTLHSVGTTISAVKSWTTVTKIADGVFAADGNLV